MLNKLFFVSSVCSQFEEKTFIHTNINNHVNASNSNQNVIMITTRTCLLYFCAVGLGTIPKVWTADLTAEVCD